MNKKNIIDYNETIKYSDYLADKINSSISYSDYLVDKINSSISYSDYLKLRKNRKKKK